VLFIETVYMFSNYFKSAWRNIRAHKSYATINIFGLAVGIAACLLIFVVVHFETSYDHFQSNLNQISRVVATYTNPTTHEITGHQGFVSPNMATAIRNDIPSIRKVAQVWYVGGAQIHIPIPGKDLADEKRVKASDGIFFADPELFGMFDYTWLTGDAKRLNEPNTCVLGESFANTFFGDWKKSMGQTLQMWSFRVPMQVVGVYKDLPGNTDMEVRMGVSYETFRKINTGMFNEPDWSVTPWPSECFVLLPAGSSPDQYQAQLQNVVKKYYPPVMNGNQHVSLSFQLLKDLHLNEDFGTFKGDALTHKELWALSLIGFFLLLVACVNFINLATAQSVNRAKEIGVRKVLGSSRTQILRQFLNETAVITGLAVLLGFLLSQLALPYVSQLMRKPLSLNIFTNPAVAFFLVLLGLVVNFLAGFYPGMVLSAFRPIEAIKSKISTSSIGGISIRRGLVVFQFLIAQLLIIGTVVVLQQMHYFRTQPMGFEKNAIAFIDLPSDSLDQTTYPYLRQKMESIPGVEAASFVMDAPASYGSNNNTFYFNGNPLKKDYMLNLQFADTGYLNTFHIGLTAGRIPYASDTMRELMVNQTLVSKLGFTDQGILGKTISFDGKLKYPIVGVIHDFHSKSLKEAITPLAISTFSRAYGSLALRINPDKMQSVLNQAQQVFTHQYPTYIYDLDFLDERIEHFYTSEAMASTLFKIAAFFAIFISCLGLYGLVSFMAAQKTKEVGIRKVLGASVPNIVLMFSREFMILIGISFLIAAPLGYYFMHAWLAGFYNHIQLSWLVFAAAILFSALVACVTVGYKAIQAATANPIKSLRSE
jgi:putative ABC transport system permease protein